METFDFDHFLMAKSYPQSSTPVQFGGGYEFTSAPEGPDQMRYTLNWPTLMYFEDEFGELDDTIEPKYNMLRLERFYERHRLYKKFIFPNPYYGNQIVRFSKPLEIPAPAFGKGGLIEGVTTELILIPT